MQFTGTVEGYELLKGGRLLHTIFTHRRLLVSQSLEESSASLYHAFPS